MKKLRNKAIMRLFEQDINNRTEEEKLKKK